MPSNRSTPINNLGRASRHELQPIPRETPLERFEMLGARLANPDLDMVDHPYAGLQRSGGVGEVEYKGKQRELSIIGIFAVSAAQERSLHQVRVELLSLKSHKTKRHSMVGRIELDGDPTKLHKDLDLIEFGIATIEIDQGITNTD